MDHFIEFQNVSKIYKMGEVEIPALHDASFTVEKGEICVIVGHSGAGKTTLLNILGGMDRLTSGRVFLDGEEISAYNKKRMTTYRRYDIGFVFQFYNLIQNLTARENVELAAQICKEPLDADEVLAPDAQHLPAAADLQQLRRKGEQAAVVFDVHLSAAHERQPRRAVDHAGRQPEIIRKRRLPSPHTLSPLR